MEEQGMIERVARAMWERHKSPYDSWETIEPFWYKTYIEKAIAALEAMREPSPRMRHAVAANWGRRTWEQYGEVIDAALNEQEKG